MLFGIPILDSASYSFDRYWRLAKDELDRAADRYFTLHRTGDPELSGAVHKSLRSADLVASDARDSKEWRERTAPGTDYEDSLRLSDMLAWAEKFQLGVDDVPCLVFVSLTGDLPVGVLRLASTWYDSDTSWRVVCRRLCAWLESDKLKGIAMSDADDDGLALRLAPVLDALTLEIDQAILAHRQRSSAHKRDDEDDRSQRGDYVFRRKSDVWLIAYAGEHLNPIPNDVAGFECIRQLLRQPRVEVPASELLSNAGLRANPSGDVSSDVADFDGLSTVASMPGVEFACDSRTVAEVREQRRVLMKAEQDAEEVGDARRKFEARAERERIEDYLRANVTIHGKPRRVGPGVGSDSVRIRQALDRAYTRIARHSTVLADHFRSFVHTGRTCVYRPDQDIRWLTDDE